jgi:hypothetical protein
MDNSSERSHKDTPADASELGDLQPTPEVETHPMESILDALEFQPTPELDELTQRLISELTSDTVSDENRRNLWYDYSIAMEQMAENMKSPYEYTKFQTAAIIYKALIFQKVGSTLRYLEELDRAEDASYLTGSVIFSDEAAKEDEETINKVNKVVRGEIDTVIKSLPMSSEVLIVKLRVVLQPLVRRSLYGMLYDEEASFEDIVRQAAIYIHESGRNPTPLLIEMGVSDAARILDTSA